MKIEHLTPNNDTIESINRIIKETRKSIDRAEMLFRNQEKRNGFRNSLIGLFLFISVSIFSQDTVYLKLNKTPIETKKELNESISLIRKTSLKTNNLYIKSDLFGYSIYCKAIVSHNKKRLRKSDIKFI